MICSVPNRSLITDSGTRLVRVYILRMEFLRLVFHISCLRRSFYIIIDTRRNSGCHSKAFKVRIRTPNTHILCFILYLYYRLLRIFKLKKRYRDIFGTLVLLSPLMWSTAIVMMVMYYFFSIIGMELFSQYDLRNCCV